MDFEFRKNVIEAMKKHIDSGEFSTKDELIKYFTSFPTELRNNSGRILSESEIRTFLDSHYFNDTIKEVLFYYDSKNKSTGMDLDGVSQFQVGNNDYIKVDNHDGTYTVLDDSQNNKNFVQQFNEKQNESMDYHNNNGTKNKEEIVKDLQKEKEEAQLHSSIDINQQELTLDQRKEFAAVMHLPEEKANNFLVDPSRNLYINKETGEVYYAHKNNFGQMEVRIVKEQTKETSVNGTVDDMDNDYIREENTDVNVFENMDDYELKYVMDNKYDSLTSEEKQKIMHVMETRNQQNPAKQNVEAMQAQNLSMRNKVLVKTLQRPYTGFTSICLLSAVTLITGVVFLLYMFMACNII